MDARTDFALRESDRWPSLLELGTAWFWLRAHPKHARTAAAARRQRGFLGYQRVAMREVCLNPVFDIFDAPIRLLKLLTHHGKHYGKERFRRHIVS